jgi:hypothetical protein
MRALIFSLPTKVALIFAGAFLPIVCFALSSNLKPEWQSGKWEAYAALLLGPASAFPFFPLLTYSAGSMIAIVCNPKRWARYFGVRLGVYAGIVLALQYFFLVAGIMGDTDACFMFVFGAPLLAAILWGIAWGIVRLFRYSISSGKHWAAPVLATVIGLAGVFLFPYFIMACIVSATPWAVFAYGAVSLRLVKSTSNRHWQFSLAQLLAAVFWSAAYCGPWRLSIKMMWIEYAKLPTSPPQCYVATAAARGHQRWVRAEFVPLSSGETSPANDQLRYLKAAELAMEATCPTMHRTVRRAYDRLGPPAATLLVHPLLADAAYVALKPAEWTARVTFTLLLPGSRSLITKLYRE